MTPGGSYELIPCIYCPRERCGHVCIRWSVTTAHHAASLVAVVIDAENSRTVYDVVRSGHASRLSATAARGALYHRGSGGLRVACASSAVLLSDTRPLHPNFKPDKHTHPIVRWRARQVSIPRPPVRPARLDRTRIHGHWSHGSMRNPATDGTLAANRSPLMCQP